jgi:hypothetical protein
VTTRIHKIIDTAFVAAAARTCSTSDNTTVAVATATDCFAAAKEVGIAHTASTAAISDPAFPTGCSAKADGHGGAKIFFNNATSTVQCGAGVTKVTANTKSLTDVNLDLDSTADTATLTLTGPDSVWFGVGFGAQAMKDAPWAVIVDGTGKVTERKLSDQGQANILLKPSVTVVSTTVNAGLRTVVLTRPLKGATKDYYTFTLDAPKLPFINAVGSTPDFRYHKDKNLGDLTLIALDGPTCICASPPKPFGMGKGKFEYHANKNESVDTGSGTVGFGNKCGGSNNKDLLDWKNPTCGRSTE